MRLFFLMLILLNGVFFAVNAFMPPKVENDPIASNEDIPQLVLLYEKGMTIKIDNPSPQDLRTAPPKKQEPSLDLKAWLAKFTAENPTIDESRNEPQLNEAKSKEQNLCYTAGPFQSTEKLEQAASYFAKIDIQPQQRSIEENHYIGMLVYLPSLESKQEVVSIAEKLAAKGVKDYMLLNEPGKQHSLSLGVYGLKKNAEQRIKALAKLNYQAESEARYRKKIVYWLDYAFSDSNNQYESSEQHLSNLKVSQIERNCKS